MAFTPEFIGNSVFAKNMIGILKSISESPVPVFLFGERGTGKRLFSQKVHLSFSSDYKFFFEINCRALEDVAILKILKKITSTDFDTNRITVFFNNINYLSRDLQYQILNEELEILTKKNAKIISSSEVDIENDKKLNFLPDLYFRLSVVKLNFLPLRQRQQDIIPIAEYYFNKFKKDSGMKIEKISDSAKKQIESFFWKGNCDELLNALQRAFIICDGPNISCTDLGINISTNNQNENEFMDDYSDAKPLKNAIDDFKKKYIIKVLQENNWNQTKTAKILGIQRTYVIKLINDLNIKKIDIK